VRQLNFRDETNRGPLQKYIQHFAGTKGKAQASTAAQVETLLFDDKLKHSSAVARRRSVNKKTLKGLLEDALGPYSPLEPTRRGNRS
jgi:hypothetical protein